MVATTATTTAPVPKWPALHRIGPVIGTAPNATVLRAPRAAETSETEGVKRATLERGALLQASQAPATADAKSASLWPMLERGEAPAETLMKKPPACRDGDLVCARRHGGMLAEENP